MELSRSSKLILVLLGLIVVTGIAGAFLFASESSQRANIREEVRKELIIDSQGNSGSLVDPDSEIIYEDKINELNTQIANLEMRLQQYEDQLNRDRNRTNIGLISFLFGGFCALWAQNTGRSPWLWFFAGVFFNVFAVIVLLLKNSDDKTLKRW